MREAEVDGHGLDDSEILVFFGLLVFAGNDTTRNNRRGRDAGVAGAPRPARAAAGRPLAHPQAVEEILRYTSVVNYFARTATCDTELGGQRIAEDEKVVIWYTVGLARRRGLGDPSASTSPAPSTTTRPSAAAGATSAWARASPRLELRIIFEEVLRRMPDIAQAGEIERLRSSWANSLTSLPVSFS